MSVENMTRSVTEVIESECFATSVLALECEDEFKEEILSAKCGRNEKLSTTIIGPHKDPDKKWEVVKLVTRKYPTGSLEKITRGQ